MNADIITHELLICAVRTRTHTYTHTHTSDFNVNRWRNSPPCFCQTSELVPVHRKDAVSVMQGLLGGYLQWFGERGKRLTHVWLGMNQGKFPRTARFELDCRNWQWRGRCSWKGEESAIMKAWNGKKVCVCVRTWVPGAGNREGRRFLSWMQLRTGLTNHAKEFRCFSWTTGSHR